MVLAWSLNTRSKLDRMRENEHKEMQVRKWKKNVIGQKCIDPFGKLIN